MKNLIKLFLLFALFLAPAYSQSLKTAEYNLGSCGGRSFTVTHAVVVTEKDKQSIQFTYHLSDPATVVKDEPTIFSVAKVEKDGEDGQRFQSVTEIDGHRLELNGLIYKDRIIAILTVDGELGHLFYGFTGGVDDMPKVATEHLQFCIFLHGTPDENLPAALISWLHGKDEAQNNSQ